MPDFVATHFPLILLAGVFAVFAVDALIDRIARRGRTYNDELRRRNGGR